jgi:hypothetical protein
MRIDLARAISRPIEHSSNLALYCILPVMFSLDTVLVLQYWTRYKMKLQNFIDYT